MIEILWADVSGLDENAAYEGFSEYRLKKLRSMRSSAARRAGIGAEMLLLHALCKYRPELALPPEICVEECGKPYLPDCDLYFNLSHSGVYAACAVSETPVGLDIQISTPYREKLAERFFAPEEQLYIEDCDDKQAAFCLLWCRKESFIKATGKGLRMELSSFSAIPGAEKMKYLGTEYSVSSLSLPSFSLAVCAHGKQKPEFRLEKIELP